MKPPLKRRLRGAPAALLRRSRKLLDDGRGGSSQSLPSFDAGAPELVLSPHWDDAVLSCWSVLTGARELIVVNVFAALPPAGHSGPWEALGGLTDSRERAERRTQEDVRALAIAGRSASNLDLPEIQNREGPEGVSLPALARALGQTAPRASRVYAPAAIGGHVDHVLVRRCAREMLARGMPVTLYADFPYCIAHGWPSWVAGEHGADTAGGDVEAYWRSFLTDVPEMPALRSGTVVHLDQGAAAAKLAAIDCYRLSLNYSVRTMLAAGRFHATEVLWELTGGQTAAVTLRSR